MGAPYQRQDTSNNIANGNIINADDLDNEFNAIETAFASVTGHSHDGTIGEGGPITVVGPAQDLVVSGTQVLPKTNNTLDLGSPTFKFKDAYVDGVLYADGINFNGTAISATAAQINHLVGVTSPIQTQLDARQPLDAELTAIAGLTSAADRVPYFTGSGTAALATFTTFGRSLVDDVDDAAGRTTLGLGTIATQNSNSITITGGTISGANITSVSSAPTTRAALGLGTASTLNVGVSANNVVQLDALSRLPAVDGSQLTGLTSFPTGGIILWSGSIASIPSGWALCDGTSGTPNLRDRFIVGAGTAYAVGATGGQNEITSVPAHTHDAGTLTASSNGAHTHTGSTSTDGAHTHSESAWVSGSQGLTGGGNMMGTGTTGSAGSHSHSLTINSSGAHTHTITGSTASAGSASVDIRPLYYALAYIMKL